MCWGAGEEKRVSSVGELAEPPKAQPNHFSECRWKMSTKIAIAQRHTQLLWNAGQKVTSLYTRVLKCNEYRSPVQYLWWRVSCWLHNLRAEKLCGAERSSPKKVWCSAVWKVNRAVISGVDYCVHCDVQGNEHSPVRGLWCIGLHSHSHWCCNV